jgi:hypothetical protein
MVFTRIIAIIISLYFLETGVYSQKIVYGLKGGFTKGTPYSKPKEEASGKLGTGPLIGAFFKHTFNKRLGIHLEFFYSNKSASFRTPVSGDTTYPLVIAGTTYNIPTSYSGWVDGKFKNYYFDMPALLAYKMGKKFNLLVGPQISYLVIGKNDGTADIAVGEDPAYPYTTVEDKPFDESSQLNKWDYGFVCGTNYETNKRLNLNLNCSIGLRSIYKKSYTNSDGMVRNIYLQFSLEYRIGRIKDALLPEQALSMK